METCVGILLNGKYYTYEYEDGNVSSIKSEGAAVCRYDYSQNALIPEIHEFSSYESEIGEINPIRYQGWFFDTDLEVYYLGQGLFYDANEQLFIEDTFSVKPNMPLSSINEYGTMALTPGEVNTITAQYTALMNDPSYGSTNCPSYVSQQDYNRGIRWYASLSPIEVVARCIYAENTNPYRLNDRVAESVAIINRMNNFSKNAYDVVTAESQFTTISGPGAVSDNSWPAKPKNKAAWQQATLLACIIYYGRKNITDISYFYTIPNYINTQLNFRSLDYLKKKTDGFVCNASNEIIVAGKVRTNVVITGYGQIKTAQDVQKAKELSGYNIFFNDK